MCNEALGNYFVSCLVNSQHLIVNLEGIAVRLACALVCSDTIGAAMDVLWFLVDQLPRILHCISPVSLE